MSDADSPAAPDDDRKSLRVLAGMDTYFPLTDGVVNCMHNLLVSYSDRIDATAFIPFTRNCPSLPYKVIRYSSFHIPFTKNVDFGFPSLDSKTLDKIRAMELDLIHVHSPFGVMKSLTRIAREKRIPIVATFHTNYRMVFRGILPLRPFCEPYIRALGRRYARMDAMFAGTEATAHQLESFGFNGECKIVPFGASLCSDESITSLSHKADAEFGLSADDTVFLFVGRIVESKRVQFIIKALRKVKDMGVAFKFLICGEGNYEGRLRSLISKLGLEDCCFMLGYVSEEQLKALYARACLFLFPSVLDNFGLVKVEAAIFCTPCVMIRGTNAAFGTSDGVNSILCEDDADDFADKISEAVRNPDRLKKISENAKRDLSFTWKQSALLLEREYRNVIRRFKETQRKA